MILIEVLFHLDFVLRQVVALVALQDGLRRRQCRRQLLELLERNHLQDVEWS